MPSHDFLVSQQFLQTIKMECKGEINMKKKFLSIIVAATMVLSLLPMSALAAGLTVGGKACGKSFAIDSSTSVVRTAAMVLHFFHTIPEKLRPKRRR